MSESAKHIVVVGGGPAGMMAAIRASQLIPSVTLIEKNPALGRKLLLSGKGRCNLTNAIGLDPFLERFSHNAQFLRDAFKKFFNRDLMDFFEERGLKLKTERQQRVFPSTDSSESVLGVLRKELEKNRVRLIFKTKVKDVVAKSGSVKGVLLEDGSVLEASEVILATGGLSYKFTGSTGDGLRFAEKLGHHITLLNPGLVPLVTQQKLVKDLEGLTLKNIRIRVTQPLRAGAGCKSWVSEIGELLFTSFGISGPLVLSLSSKVAKWLSEKKGVVVEIDLKPALSESQLDSRLLREFRAYPKKGIKNILHNLLPKRMVDVFLGVAKINPDKQVSHLTQGERQALVLLLKGLRLDIAATLPIEEAMVTCGGVSLKDIDPRTMQSRKVKGLYLCGEMIDVDADTGGFNMQAAFSTGYLAGESAALREV